MKQASRFFHQPKPVFLLSFVYMWNKFSHYGMRALLLLFMVNSLGFAEGYAFGVYAVFCALVELGGVFGALLADKILGLRRSIILGGWIIALGHLSLAMSWFYPGLALLVVGSGLFITNLPALMGKYYAIDDERRTSGFTLFYMGMNFGAFFATIFCGLLATHFGWEYGFGLAAIGMVIANLVLHKYRSLLGEKGEAPHQVPTRHKASLFPILMGAGILTIMMLMGQSLTLPLLPFLAIGLGMVIFRTLVKKRIPIKEIGIAFSSLILFNAAMEQIGSSILLFADKMGQNTLFGWKVSSSAILAMNPVVIVLFGTLVYAIGKRMNSSLRLLTPFLLAAAAFSSLLLLQGIVPLSALMGVVALISLAELFIGPMVFSACSRVSLQADDPKVMGLVPIGASLAALLGGGISKTIHVVGYTQGFLLFALLLVVGGGLLSLAQRKQQGAKKEKVM